MKKIIINLVLLLSIICTASFSYAEGAQLEARIEVSANVIEVSVGDQVTFTLVTRDIANAVDNGKIYAIGGKLVYDTNFFELAGTNGITLGDTGLFNSTNAVTEGGTNGTITLKVKESATGSATVTFTDLTASDGRLDDMETLGTAKSEEQSFTITVKVAEEPVIPPVDTPSEDEGKTEDVIPEQKPNDTTEGDKKEDNTTTGGNKLPQTGIENVGMIVVFMGIASLVSYVAYKKYKDI